MENAAKRRKTGGQTFEEVPQQPVQAENKIPQDIFKPQKIREMMQRSGAKNVTREAEIAMGKIAQNFIQFLSEKSQEQQFQEWKVNNPETPETEFEQQALTLKTLQAVIDNTESCRFLGDNCKYIRDLDFIPQVKEKSKQSQSMALENQKAENKKKNKTTNLIQGQSTMLTFLKK